MAGKARNIARTPVRFVFVTLDSHLRETVRLAEAELRQIIPGLDLCFHAAADFDRDANARAACVADIENAHYIVASMLFMEPHINAVLPAIQARKDACDAVVGLLSASDVAKTTHLGKYRMDKPDSAAVSFLKRLRHSGGKSDSGARQMKILKQIPKILKFIPGAAQDMRAYFLTMQYMLAGSDSNIVNLVKFLVDRYASGPRASLRGALNPAAPCDYPDVGVYHPRMTPAIGEECRKLPYSRSTRPSVGLLLMRSYLLAGDTGHYDGVIDAFEARGMRVVPIFASGLDARCAIEKFLLKDGAPQVDALVSLTGFSLVGGPAYNNSEAAADILARLDMPYVAAQALEFQTLEDWRANEQGLTPIEATMMVAIPELDGATGPIVFGGRAANDNETGRRMRAAPDRANRLAARVEKLIALKRKDRAAKKIAIVLFNFPPNSGGVGTAAHLGVFESLANLLADMKRGGYAVDAPTDATALRALVVDAVSGDALVAARISADDHVRREPRLRDIEKQWGAAPGRFDTDGRNLLIRGVELGNVFIAVQPAMGFEGDPMRLLFDKSFAPTHAFSAFYRYLREDFAADAVLHFGTHGALEFMPGKHAGMGADCWPDTLIGDTPHFYLYAANNPSEAAIAKRRSAATIVSYLTPAVTEAGLYAGLADLKDLVAKAIDQAEFPAADNAHLFDMIAKEAARYDLNFDPASNDALERLRKSLNEIERALIPDGLHVVGAPLSPTHRADFLRVIAGDDAAPDVAAAIDALSRGEAFPAASPKAASREEFARLAEIDRRLRLDTEIPAILHALDGGFIRPVVGGDVVRNPDVLPTGRNVHGFDPFRLPSLFACAEGARQASLLLDRWHADQGRTPESVAIVLWGTDNLKSEGAQLAQALSLMGAAPRYDGYGRLAGARLLPLDELSRPRIDVVATLSGIFRDLLPLQTRMLAEAALLAATADEPADLNFIRKHALAYQAAHGCDMETAALRIFSNAEGAYGANVNHLVEAGCWDDEDDLASAFMARKCFAYGVDGKPSNQTALLRSALADVDLAYQNLESVELGLTTIDHYFDTLGGIGRAVKRAKGEDAAIYIGDQTRGAETVRSLEEQVALESRTRTLNPKWYEGMLRHGYEGVRQIEAHVTNTMGWSATTGQVPPWIYQSLTETFVLDDAMRRRLAALNPKSCARVASRLIEASDRDYWRPDADTLNALRRAGDELEDMIEGVGSPAQAAIS